MEEDVGWHDTPNGVGTYSYGRDNHQREAAQRSWAARNPYVLPATPASRKSRSASATDTHNAGSGTHSSTGDWEKEHEHKYSGGYWTERPGGARKLPSCEGASTDVHSVGGARHMHTQVTAAAANLKGLSESETPEHHINAQYRGRLLARGPEQAQQLGPARGNPRARKEEPGDRYHGPRREGGQREAYEGRNTDRSAAAPHMAAPSCPIADDCGRESRVPAIGTATTPRSPELQGNGREGPTTSSSGPDDRAAGAGDALPLDDLLRRAIVFANGIGSVQEDLKEVAAHLGEGVTGDLKKIRSAQFEEGSAAFEALLRTHNDLGPIADGCLGVASMILDRQDGLSCCRQHNRRRV